MRQCPGCHKTKTLDEYHVDRLKKNGHTSRCKECNCAAKVQERRDHPDRVLSRYRRYYSNNRDGRAWTGIDALRQAAYGKVKWAIQTGEIIRPHECDDCRSSDFTIEAHHDDYHQPLNVRWLCKPCHYEADRRRP